MGSHKNKYILYLSALNGLLIALLIAGGKNIFEYGQSIGGIAIAIALFFLYELFVILGTEKISKAINSRQSVNLFLAFKAGKIILSLFFIAIYAITVKVELKRFILVFIILYFIYLFFDTVYLVSREKKNKKEYHLKEIEKLSNRYKK